MTTLGPELHTCDRCRDRFPWDAMRQGLWAMYGQLCQECWEAVETRGER